MKNDIVEEFDSLSNNFIGCAVFLSFANKELSVFLGNNFIDYNQIAHEYLLNFRKDRLVFGLFDASLNISRKLQSLAKANWCAVIRTALNKIGGKGRLSEIYDAIERGASELLSNRPNWQARVRATLQAHFQNLERGVWAIQN